MKHATIIPLIGGEAIASTEVFGSRPDYIMSYSPFRDNESHLLNYWNHEVPYYLIDEGGRYPHQVDVVSSVCPCAGLSLFSMGYGDHNQNNRWMLETAKYVLGDMKPEVFWGENAPGLAGKVGTTIRKQLAEIGKENGYSMTLYRTKSLLHGVPQIRERTFYFFWKGDKTPLLEYYNREHVRIEDVITGTKSNTMNEVINNDTPTKDPYYRYLLEQIHGGITHRQHFDVVDSLGDGVRYFDVRYLIEKHGHNYKQVGDWMAKNGYAREVERCGRMFEKISSGKNIMRRGTNIPKNFIGAFVGHYPLMLTHPYEDRYVTYREALSIMGMPQDFELLNPSKSYNHICQNVPVQTAMDMAEEVKAYMEGKRNMVNSRLTFQYNSTRSHEIHDQTADTSLEVFFN